MMTMTLMMKRCLELLGFVQRWERFSFACKFHAANRSMIAYIRLALAQRRMGRKAAAAAAAAVTVNTMQTECECMAVS